MNIISMISNFLEKIKPLVIQYAPNIVNDEIIFFDFETTGLNPFHNKIIEYCFMLTDENTEISDIVNPEEKIEKKITDITGIHPDMFENKDGINIHIEKIYDFINGNYINSIFSVEKKYLVAHNAIGFDSIFLEKELYNFKKINQNVTTKNFVYLDTLLLARKLLPELKSHSLASLAKHYNLSSGTHRASSDVKCLKGVFDGLIRDLSNHNGIPTSYYYDYPQEIINFINY